MNRFLLLLFFTTIFSFSYSQTFFSPDKRLSLVFSLTKQGEPEYQLFYENKPVVAPSRLGILLLQQKNFADVFSIANIETTSVDNSWNPVWGEVKTIRNHYNEMKITLKQNYSDDNDIPHERRMILAFRLFNDGLGFRYEFPKQPELGYFIVTDELTQFAMTGAHKTFWIPGDYDSNEYPYNHTALSEINGTALRNASEISTRSTFGRFGVQTPLMMKTNENLYINIFEAALVNYPAMNLVVDTSTFLLSAHLVPDMYGNKAYLQTPFTTPWRTILVSDKAEDILSSKMILNLNEPCTLSDVSWITPQKFIGVWWELHVGKSTWNYADTGNLILAKTDWSKLTPNGKHGATTARVKYYIDFASKHKIDAVLVEGWNIGWEDWFGEWKEEVFDFVTPYPDFNVVELQKYAAEKNVKLIMHHETSASVTNYERRMDSAYRFMKEYGYETVKTGYVGRIIPRGEHHDGQWMVNHYQRVTEKTASYKIMVDMHEPVRPTGLHRTYPNWLANEAARGNEFNAWSIGNAPDHETILPFTRLLGGPMDYTPGIFQTEMSYYKKDKKERVHTTLVKQLALYVTMYSPLQMAADLPENYERFSDAFTFIEDVPVDWDDTKILDAEPGEYISIARKAKNKNEWYLGAVTDEHRRTMRASLSFLSPKQKYTATLYCDAPNAHWEKNPMAYTIKKYLVTGKTTLKLLLAPGGGAAVSIKPATKEEEKLLKNYQ